MFISICFLMGNVKVIVPYTTSLNCVQRQGERITKEANCGNVRAVWCTQTWQIICATLFPCSSCLPKREKEHILIKVQSVCTESLAMVLTTFKNFTALQDHLPVILVLAFIVCECLLLHVCTLINPHFQISRFFIPSTAGTLVNSSFWYAFQCQIADCQKC